MATGGLEGEDQCSISEIDDTLIEKLRQ